jgi:hypothetical protein
MLPELAIVQMSIIWLPKRPVDYPSNVTGKETLAWSKVFRKSSITSQPVGHFALATVPRTRGHNELRDKKRLGHNLGIGKQSPELSEVRFH